MQSFPVKNVPYFINSFEIDNLPESRLRIDSSDLFENIWSLATW